MNPNDKKQYLAFDAATGYPAGSRIRYECANCGGILESLPEHAVACKCRNVIVDSDAGRVSVKDLAQFRIFELL
ncbi:hypothetical protein M0D69_22540 [Caballeronia sp. SEWSISQ10-4 2]|uniref:hypothetical protein n=1 Tax=Caballeronia sp. SEWSISQ10-4 2 TaxID=2937438 RepID=UPI00264CA216|nr:hypothetical protein [Caballeronia sp. SEWSISQ10-4 2]MDN7180725.1 hypothetical protein [Caballeronia sp. SEWSISQ10-4 2]